MIQDDHEWRQEDLKKKKMGAGRRRRGKIKRCRQDEKLTLSYLTGISRRMSKSQVKDQTEWKKKRKGGSL